MIFLFIIEKFFFKPLGLTNPNAVNIKDGKWEIIPQDAPVNKIEYEKVCSLSSLKYGSIFRYNEELYVKTQEYVSDKFNDYVKCVKINNGEIVKFLYHQDVSEVVKYEV